MLSADSSVSAMLSQRHQTLNLELCLKFFHTPMSIAREGNQRLMSASILAITPAKDTRALVLYAIPAILQTVIFFVNKGENMVYTLQKN